MISINKILKVLRDNYQNICCVIHVTPWHYYLIKNCTNLVEITNASSKFIWSFDIRMIFSVTLMFNWRGNSTGKDRRGKRWDKRKLRPLLPTWTEIQSWKKYWMLFCILSVGRWRHTPDLHWRLLGSRCPPDKPQEPEPKWGGEREGSRHFRPVGRRLES